MPRGLIKGMTPKRQQVLAGLAHHWQQVGRAPTMRVLAAGLGISPQEAWRVCNDLVREGFAVRSGAPGTKGRFKPVDNNES